MSWKETKSWYTTNEVAEILGRSDRFVRDRIKSGEINASEHKGAKRSSYKISAEALAAYAIANQENSKEALALSLKSLGEGQLQKLMLLAEAEISCYRNPHWEILPHCDRMHKPAMALEAKRLEGEFVYQDSAVYDNYKNNPLNFTSTLINRNSGEAEAHFGVEITSVEYFEKVCKGLASDDYQPPWEPGQTPMFYVDVLIVEDPLCTPFLFRHMLGQLREFMRKNRLKIEACFTVASSPEAIELAKKYGFEQIGLYEDKYPIVLSRNVWEGRIGRMFLL